MENCRSDTVSRRALTLLPGRQLYAVYLAFGLLDACGDAVYKPDRFPYHRWKPVERLAYRAAESGVGTIKARRRKCIISDRRRVVLPGEILQAERLFPLSGKTGGDVDENKTNDDAGLCRGIGFLRVLPAGLRGVRRCGRGD